MKKIKISEGLIKVGFYPKEFKMLMDICKTAETVAPRKESVLIKNARTWKDNFKLLWKKNEQEENPSD